VANMKYSISCPARFFCLMTLSSAPAFLFAGAGAVNDPILYKQGFLQVVSPDGATLEQCKLAAKKVSAAWKFDLNLMKWAHPEVMERPFILRLVSDERMKQQYGRVVNAMTSGDGNRINVRMSLLDTGHIDLTIAHELGHVQMRRAMGKSPHRSSVPNYFIEGHGQMMNWNYADYLHMDKEAGARTEVKVIMALAPEELEQILTDDKYDRVGTPEEKAKKSFKMECVGLFLMEHLRTQKGIPDAVQRMGQVFEAVGSGLTYEQAFARVYGFSVKRAVAELVANFKRTAANPAGRVEGTRWEPYVPAAK